MTEALFVPEGAGYLATEWCRGGWDDETLHGGPPAGLMAWAIEQHPAPEGMHMARVTFDLFRPIRLGYLEIKVETVRAGRRIQVDRVVLGDGSRELASATALRMRQTPTDLGTVVLPPWEDPGPPNLHPRLEWMQHGGELIRFHTTTVETRSVGGSMEGLGPGTAWHRLTVPVMAGQVTSPAVHAAALSDMLNGVSRTLRFPEWIYVNPDITMYLARPPVGEWIGIRGESRPHPNGIGVNNGIMFDRDGPVGALGMSQLIEPATRETPPGFPNA